jgi:hypothetical protein
MCSTCRLHLPHSITSRPFAALRASFAAESTGTVNCSTGVSNVSTPHFHPCDVVAGLICRASLAVAGQACPERSEGAAA